MKILDILNFSQLFVGTALLVLGVYTFWYKEDKVSKSLAWFLFLASFWCFLSVITIGIGSIEDKIFFTRIRLIAPIFLPAIIVTLALNLNGEIKFNKIYLFIFPAIFAGIVVSPWHELFITNYSFLDIQGVRVLTYKNGPVFMVHNILSRIFCLASFFIIIKGMKGRHRFQKMTGAMIIVSIALPFIVDTIAVNFYEVFRYLQLVPVSLGFTGMLMTYALFVHGSLDLVPYARSQVLSYLGDPCLMWDRKGLLVDCNPAAAKLFDIASDIRGFDASSKGYLKNNNQEVPWVDGRTFHIRFEEIKDDSGCTMGSFSLLRDITELKHAEEKLIKINRVKTNILGVLSHDLCGHAGQLNLITELLMFNHGELEEKEIRELTEGAFFLSKDLNVFLSNLLDWSKEQFSDWGVKKEQLKVRELVDGVCSFLSRSAALKKQNLKNEISPHLVLETDSKMLEIILRNLVYNAIKHSALESTIRICGNDLSINIHNEGELSSLDVELINQYFSIDEVESIPTNGLGHKICKEFSKILNMQILAQTTENQVTFALMNKQIAAHPNG